MDPKKLIIAAVVTAFIITLIILALIGLFKFYPEFYGLESPGKDTMEVEKQIVYFEPAIQLSRNEFDNFQKKSLKVDLLEERKKTLEKKLKILNDSITSVNKFYEEERINVKQLTDSINKRNNHSAELLDSISRLNNTITKSNKQLEMYQSKISDMERIMETRLDSLERKNFEVFAKIYDNSSPVEVARILERIDERDAARILKNMQKRKAGKVLDAMNPEHSAAILLLGIVD